MNECARHRASDGQVSYTPEQLREVIKSISMMTIDEVIRAHATALEENAKLRSAIRWALGYDEGEPQFQPRGAGDPPYWWRDELMRRADFKEPSNG